MCWVSHIRWQSASHLYCLNVSHVLVYTHLCACMYVRWNGERRLLRNSCNKNCVRTCVKICSFICLLVCDFDIFSSCACALSCLCWCVCACACCRINQSNYLWWWINRFVFRWRAQLAALSTTNCRRIEWWNLERERVLGQSQCYSWFRGFFLTQQGWTLYMRDTVAILIPPLRRIEIAS